MALETRPSSTWIPFNTSWIASIPSQYFVTCSPATLCGLTYEKTAVP
jgi:hypothetical protein